MKPGEEIGLSRWFTIDQPRIDAFARVTEDEQFVHVDAVRAAEGPFGGTVAHGFLTLSMLSAMAYDALPDVAGSVASVNYGFDRIRFLSPVPSGARLRGRFTLEETREAAVYRDLILAVTVEIEGADRPALAARWIIRHLIGATAA
ncbi:MAG: MaoC family dehydratase [Rubricella sp.]